MHVATLYTFTVIDLQFFNFFTFETSCAETAEPDQSTRQPLMDVPVISAGRKRLKPALIIKTSISDCARNLAWIWREYRSTNDNDACDIQHTRVRVKLNLSCNYVVSEYAKVIYTACNCVYITKSCLCNSSGLCLYHACRI